MRTFYINVSVESLWFKGSITVRLWLRTHGRQPSVAGGSVVIDKASVNMEEKQRKDRSE